jgi:hypothetical protein
MAGRVIDHDRARDSICKALSAGNTRRASCAYAGISEDTLAIWMDKDSDFSDSVKKAEADAEVRHVANIAKAAGEGTWTASAWWLERRAYQEWGRKDRIDVAILKAPNEQLIDLVLGAGEDVAAGEAVSSSSAEAAGRGPGSALPAAGGDPEQHPFLPEHADTEAG